MTRKISIGYKGNPVDLEMLDTVLSCFNQNITIAEARYFINLGDEKKCLKQK